MLQLDRAGNTRWWERPYIAMDHTAGGDAAAVSWQAERAEIMEVGGVLSRDNPERQASPVGGHLSGGPRL